MSAALETPQCVPEYSRMMVPACGGSQDEPTERRQVCPHCSGTRIAGHGWFARKSGGLARRFRCLSCGRTFSTNTGTPAAYIKHQSKFRKMVEQMVETSSLRVSANQIGVHLSTMFRWRHRWLAAKCREERPALEGQVAVSMAAVPYSEKGSRICRGPGSWGYWNRYLRGPQPDRLAVPVVRSEPFRPLIDGRAVSVLVAHNRSCHASVVLGQKPGVDRIQDAIKEVVSPRAEVHDFGRRAGRSQIAEACERLNLPCLDGQKMMPKAKTTAERLFASGQWQNPNSWLVPFRRVATKYLHHYMAWFSYQMTYRMRLLATLN